MNDHTPANDNCQTYGEILDRCRKMRMEICNYPGRKSFALRRYDEELLKQIKALEERIFRICSELL
jgi:hypothetical protein